MTAQVTLGGIHLSNSTGAPVAGGVATAAATTPFSIRKGWSLAAADPNAIMGGGAPFTIGSRLAYLGYNSIDETIPIAVTGSSHVNAVARLQELKRAVDTTLFSTAPLMSVLEDGSSTIMYSEIQYAVVREVTENESGFEGWEALSDDIYAEVRIVRSPFFTPAGLTTLINAATFNNTGTGGSSNTQSLGSPAGDLIYEGQPLNLKLTPTSGATGFYDVALGTVYQRTYTTSSATTTTSSTVGAQAFSDTTVGLISPARTRNGLKLRVLHRLTSLSAKAQLQLVLSAHSVTVPLYVGPWVQPGALAAASQVDLTPQGVSLDLIRRAQLTNGDIDVYIFIRSTDGTSVSVTNHSVETILYYTWCQIHIPSASQILGTTTSLFVEQAQNLNGTAYQPCPGVAFSTTLSGGVDYLTNPGDVRGTLPRAISGASLYVSLLGGYSHPNTMAVTVTASHLPLYRSLRGAN